MIDLRMRKFWYILMVFIIGLGACKRNSVSWDVDQTIPLFHSSFSLNDVDTKYLKYGVSDSGYRLEYENTLYSYKINDLQVSDTGIDASFNLRKLRLNDQVINNTVTLGENQSII